jgi:thiol-disulfide isomerase/thioredoxin
MMESMMKLNTYQIRPSLLANSAMCMLVILLTVLSPTAQAQTATEILDASRDALLETPGFQAQFRMKGIGGAMFADTMPSMNGQMFFGTNEEFGRVIRTVGENKDKQSDPSSPLDQLITEDRFIWVDRKKQTITQSPNTPKPQGVPSSLSLVLLRSIINGDPYAKDTDGAVAITLGAQEEIAGELCDQILIKRPKAKGSTRVNAQSYTDAVWWISTKDKLPRKVQHITDAGLVKITLEFSLSNLRVVSLDEKQLDVARPDGFEFVSKMPRPVRLAEEQQTKQPVPNTTPQTNNTTQPVQNNTEPTTRPTAYSFSTSEGSSVDNTTQLGRVTALYFTGSWCVPCVETSSLIETMRNNLDGEDVDVYALAIREGDPNRAQRVFSAEYPNTPISINPENLTAIFKVRIYPTIVVLDRDGIIAYQKSISKGFGSDKLVEEVTSAIREALTDS